MKGGGSSPSTTYFALTGGLDQLSPEIVAKAGTVKNAINYESYATGYRRMDGYERFDGRLSPTDATWYLLNFDAGVAAMPAGSVLTGATSGASGTILVDATVETGSFGASNAAGFVALGTITGTFVDNELLKIAGVTKAVMNGAALEADSRNDSDATLFSSLARTNARALIQTVPGSGPVRGVWKHLGTLYAFRDNAGATAGTMWKATTAGWVQVTFGRTIPFTAGGTVAIAEGDTITGATSGATAIVRRVVVQSGSWTSSSMAGYLVVDTQTGSFVGEAIKVGGSNRATIAGNSVAITLPPGGRYECITENFYGAANLKRMYVANGVGPAFEFDGTTLAPIITGMPVEAPTFIAEHNGALLLGFPGGSLEISVVGNPLDWRGQLGAVDIGMGDEITGFIPKVASSTIILCQNRIGVLNGHDSTDYVLNKLTDEAGALSYSAARIGNAIYMDARGIRSVTTTQAYGNFTFGTITVSAPLFIKEVLKRGAKPAVALRVRSKDQYRLFFDDQTGMTIYFGKKNPETMPFQFAIQPRCGCSYDNLGVEELYVGCDDGFVYRLDYGTDFDGAPLPYYLRLHYNHLGAPQIRKRWHKAVVACDVQPKCTLFLSADFDYGSGEDIGINDQSFAIQGGGGSWDLSNWNEFYWSSPQAGEMTADLDGVSKNLSLLFAGEAANEAPHLLEGVTLFYTVRGLVR